MRAFGGFYFPRYDDVVQNFGRILVRLEPDSEVPEAREAGHQVETSGNHLALGLLP